MKNSIKKFLEFNGKAILFKSIDGQFWVALKPICEALYVQWINQFQRLKEDKILGQLLSNQIMVGADNRSRKMVALPEKYVYGWLFSIQSGSDALQNYKLKCYEVLYDYFHGSIGARSVTLIQKATDEQELAELEETLKVNTDFKRYNELKGRIARSGIVLKQLDKNFVDSQLSMFSGE